MLLISFKPKTPSLRWKKNFFTINYFNLFIYNFLYKTFKKKGRSNLGKITVRHKKTPKKNFTSSANFFFFKKSLGLIVSSFFIKKTKKLLALIKYSDGSFFIIPFTSNSFLGFFFFFNLSSFFFKKDFLIASNLIFLKINLIISNLGKKNSKIQYSKASGCLSLVTNIFLEKKKVLIQLPSGNTKFFHTTSYFCLLGRCAVVNKKSLIIGKAGSNILAGDRPTVRGNAMNPIDHPHGGRTKTSKPEVSPWGWVAKKNK